jgi:hypothetical protein
MHIASLAVLLCGVLPSCDIYNDTFKRAGRQGFMYRLHVVYLVKLSTGLGD